MLETIPLTFSSCHSAALAQTMVMSAEPVRPPKSFFGRNI